MFVVSYDFSNDKVRTKFAKFLKKYGRRLQYSVREIKNSDRILNIILVEIERIFEKSIEMTDSVIIIRICEWCEKKIVRYGYSVSEEEELIFT